MTYDVFYCCYGTGQDRADPAPMQLDDILTLPAEMLRAPDDFFGLVDAHGTTLQVMREPQNVYWVEIPMPKQRGSHGARLTLEQLDELLRSLPTRFEPGVIPGGKFEGW